MLFTYQLQAGTESMINAVRRLAPSLLAYTNLLVFSHHIQRVQDFYGQDLEDFSFRLNGF